MWVIGKLKLSQARKTWWLDGQELSQVVTSFVIYFLISITKHFKVYRTFLSSAKNSIRAIPSREQGMKEFA